MEDIQGVPAGLTAEPIAAPGGPVQGVPAGLTASPVVQADHSAGDEQAARLGLDKAPAAQPGFLSRSVQTSPIGGLIEMAKSKWNQAKQAGQTEVDAVKQIQQHLKDGNLGAAAEAILNQLSMAADAAGKFSPHFDVDAAKNSGTHILNMAHHLEAGNNMEAASEAAKSIPMLGGIGEQVGKPLGDDLGSGNYAGAAGDVVGGTASALAAASMGKTGEAEAVGKAEGATEAASAKAIPAVAEEPGMLRPGATKVPGVNKPVPTMASGPVADAAKKLVDPRAIQTFNKEAIQPALKEGIGDVATSAQSAAMKDVAQTVGSRKLPVVLTESANFGEAGEKLQKTGQQTFRKLDDLTKAGGEEKTFSELQAEKRQLERTGTFDEIKEAKARIVDMEDKYKDHFEPGELEQANSLYSKGAAMKEIHEALTGPSVTKPTPATLLKKGETDLGMIDGDGLAKKMRQFATKKDKVSGKTAYEEAGISASHAQSLQDLANIASRNAPKLNSTAQLIAKAGIKTAAGVAGHLSPLGAVGGIALESGAEYATTRILSKIMTDPRALKSLTTGLAAKASPGAIAKQVSEMLQKSASKAKAYAKVDTSVGTPTAKSLAVNTAASQRQSDEQQAIDDFKATKQALDQRRRIFAGTANSLSK